MDKKSYIEAGDKVITDRYAPRAGDHLTPAQLKAMTPRDVINRLKELKPFFASQARANEKAGRPSDEVWHKLLSTGYMHLLIHKNFGGFGATAEEMLEATDILCEADGSLGWIAMFLVNTPRQVGAYPRHVQELIYKDGKAPTVTNLISPTGTAKKVPGGYLVSGRWVWCTTIQFTSWVSMFAQVEDENGNRGPMRTFLAPADKVTIIETWEAHGMAGTGTHHVVGEDIFVSDDMTPGDHKSQFAWGKNSKEVFPDYPIMHASAAPWGAMSIAATVVASANGAVEYARERLKHYNKRGSAIPEKEKMSQQMRLARASVLATAAKLLVYKAAQVCCEALTEDDAPERDEYYQVQAWSGEAAEMARQVTTLLMQSNGTSVHYLNSPVGRMWRDVHTGSSHASVDYDPTIQRWGQQMLGVKPNDAISLGDRNLVRDELAATKSGDFSRTSTETHVIRAI